MKKINDSVFYTGVLNPNLRVFDIIMKTEFGTSYNSYLVKGGKAVALVETAHASFFDYFLENVKAAAYGRNIDYLIINHCEPDHTGAVARLLEIYPSMQILTSAAGAIYIKNITKKSDLNIRIVKDNDALDLGGKTIKFISAPFLHWPDSMFSYLVEDKIVFTCDFLGSHYCEPQVYDTKISYPQRYREALKYYFDAIFGPFLPYVRKGLEKLSALDAEMALTSHGPILTKGGILNEVISSYKEWSKEKVKDKALIPIFYCSAYGNTQKIAKAIEDGVKRAKPGANVKTYNVIEHDTAELGAILNESDAFLIGSPTINKDAVPPVYALLSHIDAVNIVKRPAALFGSFGWSGEALANVAARLESVKCNVYPTHFKLNFTPSDDELERAKEFGESFIKANFS